MEIGTWIGIAVGAGATLLAALLSGAEATLRGNAGGRPLGFPLAATPALVLLALRSLPVGLAVGAAAVVAGGESWQATGMAAGVALGVVVAAQLAAHVVAARYPGSNASSTWPLARALRRLSARAMLLDAEAKPAAPVTLAEVQHEGPLEPEEAEMIRGVLDLDRTMVREIMVPRVDVAALNVAEPVARAVEMISSRGFSRMPLYRETIDSILGMVYAKDLLARAASGEEPASLEEIARPALFVPAAMHLDELLKEFRRRKVHAAVVVDEYGGTAGIATIEDLLEEIVGEIEDEFDRQETLVSMVTETEGVVDARLPIEEFNETFGVAIEAADFDTVGGYVFSKLEKIPKPNDEIVDGRLVISVLSTVGHRINKVYVRRSTDTKGP